MHLHPRRRRIEPVGKSHGPGQFAGNAVVAVAGGEAADAPDRIADRGCWRSQIECPQSAEASHPALHYERNDSSNEAAEPGKSSSRPQNRPAVGVKLSRRIEHMPELGADDSSYHGQSDHSQRVRRLPLAVDDMLAAKAVMQHNSAANRRNPKHQTKGRDIPRTEGSKVNSNMDIRQHTFPSIDGGGTQDEESIPRRIARFRNFVNRIGRDSLDRRLKQVLVFWIEDA